MDRMVKIAKYLLLGFLGLGVIGMFLPDTASQSETKTIKIESSKSPSSKPVKKDSTPGLGSKVRDGKFEFVVTSIRCGIHTVETYKTNTALGEYCKATVKFTNIGDKAQYVDATNQILIDSQDREFKASIGSDSINFLSINPGLGVTGDIYFDVPVGTKINYIELHDSMFSGGIKVKA